MKKIFILAFAVIMLSASSILADDTVKGDVDWSKTDPLAFIKILKETPKHCVMVNGAPRDWIKREHVEELMKLIDSKDPAAPVMSVLSSTIPDKKSTVGNEVMFLIEGFKLGGYPQGICSTCGFKGIPDDYRRWWEAVRMYEMDFRKKHSYRPPPGYVPDEETAIKIAEAVLIPIYGKEVIEKEKPFNVWLVNGTWVVTGTLHCPSKNRCLGGVAVVEIYKDDGRVLRVSHGE